MQDALDALRFIGKSEHHVHVWKDGEYQGCMVTYAHPLHPDLKTVFHPYAPLMIAGQERHKVTREYFERHGWPVPGDE